MTHSSIIRQQELERRQRLQRIEQQIERDRQHAEQLAQQNQSRLQSQWMDFGRVAEDAQARLITAAKRALNPFDWF